MNSKNTQVENKVTRYRQSILNQEKWSKEKTDSRNKEIAKRLYSKCKKRNDCLEWQGCLSNRTPNISVSAYRSVSARKWLWEYYNGKVPEGYRLYTKCKNNKCMTIKHMELIKQNAKVTLSVNKEKTKRNNTVRMDVDKKEDTPEVSKVLKEIRHLREEIEQIKKAMESKEENDSVVSRIVSMFTRLVGRHK